MSAEEFIASVESSAQQQQQQQQQQQAPAEGDATSGT